MKEGQASMEVISKNLCMSDKMERSPDLLILEGIEDLPPEQRDEFARACAKSVDYMWDAAKSTREYLRTGDRGLREGAVADAKKHFLNPPDDPGMHAARAACFAMLEEEDGHISVDGAREAYRSSVCTKVVEAEKKARDAQIAVVWAKFRGAGA